MGGHGLALVLLPGFGPFLPERQAPDETLPLWVVSSRLISCPFGKLGRSFVAATYPEMKCTFCITLALIETAKTNERRQLIHEDCYLHSLQRNGHPRINSASDSN
jgi:hypothetical protein